MGFIRDGHRGLQSVGDREVSEELRNIACTEDLVNGGKVCSALFVAEVGGENATLDTFPPKELAGSTGGSKSCHLGLWVIVISQPKLQVLSQLFINTGERGRWIMFYKYLIRLGLLIGLQISLFFYA